MHRRDITLWDRPMAKVAPPCWSSITSSEGFRRRSTCLSLRPSFSKQSLHWTRYSHFSLDFLL